MSNAPLRRAVDSRMCFTVGEPRFIAALPIAASEPAGGGFTNREYEAIRLGSPEATSLPAG
jgi:hypothetical protein